MNTESKLRLEGGGMGPSGQGDTCTAVRRLPQPSAVGTGLCAWSPQTLLGQRICGARDSPTTKINTNTNVKIRKRSVRIFFFAKKRFKLHFHVITVYSRRPDHFIHLTIQNMLFSKILKSFHKQILIQPKSSWQSSWV